MKMTTKGQEKVITLTKKQAVALRTLLNHVDMEELIHVTSQEISSIEDAGGKHIALRQHHVELEILQFLRQAL